MVGVKDANAMAEVIHYLKGIKQEDIDRIPKKLMQYLNENASKDYRCDFDYNKPLRELNLLDESRGIIGMICYNYWCITENQREEYLKKLSKNEQEYQEILHEKYNPDNLFLNKDEKKIEQTSNVTEIIKYKESIFKKLILKIKKFLHK